jgi:phage terminase large subunit
MPHLKVNRKLEPFLLKSKPVKVAIGGRGSGKSIGFGDIFTMKMETEKADIYCLREYQDSVLDSVHRVFVDSINDRLQLSGWDIQENKVIAPTGARTNYKGASRNPDSIQSAQGYKYSWFEEAHRASKASLDKLLPTILRNPGAECWFSANPQSSGDPFSQRFIVPYQDELDRHGYYEDDIHLIVVVNWRDNPWWNEEQERLRKWDFENRPRAEYDWIWEGRFNDTVENSIIKQEWFDAALDAHKIERLQSVFKPTGAVVAAHDPSGQGSDSKGYACRHGSIIKKVREKNDGDIDDGFDWAVDESLEDNADWFVFDADGMGSGAKRQVSDAFRGMRVQYHMFRGSLSGSAQDNAENVYLPVNDSNGSKPKTYMEEFFNNRAQYYFELARRFENTYRCVVKGQYIAPDDMISIDTDGVDNIVKLRAELCRLPRKPNGRGLKQVMSKEDMAKMDIKSPNMGDSVMMTMFMPPAVQVQPKIPRPLKTMGR